MQRTIPMTRNLTLLLLTAFSLHAAADVRELEWPDLMPEEESQAWIDNQMSVDHTGAGPSPAFQSSTTVGELDGEQVRIPGFVVPVETTPEGKLSEFFLVPYFGACIHIPPPPANQIIYGRLEEPVEMVNIWDAFWMQGTLHIEDVSNETADSAYTMDVSSLTLY
ncbi:MAG: DUF3299 domain-containing protein [Wenzhouxiangellaceae bacterium]|nr:DUF3299 domain-containing protein [Wenzhouxiangellaceae bacterium]